MLCIYHKRSQCSGVASCPHALDYHPEHAPSYSCSVKLRVRLVAAQEAPAGALGLCVRLSAPVCAQIRALHRPAHHLSHSEQEARAEAAEPGAQRGRRPPLPACAGRGLPAVALRAGVARRRAGARVPGQPGVLPVRQHAQLAGNPSARSPPPSCDSPTWQSGPTTARHLGVTAQGIAWR